MMDKSNKNLIGLIVIIIGVMLLFDQMGITNGFSIGYIFATFWPLFLVWIGVSALINHRTRVGLFFLFLGLLFQASTLYGWSVWGILWPLAIIFVGISALIGRPVLRPNMSSSTEQTNKLKEFVAFWGSDRRVVSDNFTGGEITTIFGGTQIDLRDVTVANEGATLSVTCVFGGVEIIVNPSKYRINSQGTPFLGGWENSFTRSNDDSLPILTITGSVVFGGVDIKG